MRTKVRYHKDRLKEDLKNPEFCKHYAKEKKSLEIAYQIARLRHKLGLSQKDFARRVGTTQQVISRLENGKYTGYTLKTLEKLANATNTELVISFRSMQVA
ncbi:MAG TPA: helix-turn-helix transcriptional regulator [Candidatus Brocadiia bacterium]|nr:helix-turn-helix transcriptional regulator [Candidatus Brocadiales bacterium]